MNVKTSCLNKLLIVCLYCNLVACSHFTQVTPVATLFPDIEVTSTPTSPPVYSNDSVALIQPTDLHYIGAFRLPEGEDRPLTFAYGGNAMTYNPQGDASSPDDGFPGSLFITGHDRLAYGELPDGSQVAEVSIPIPAISELPVNLPSAGFLQEFQNVTKGFFANLDEIPRIGLAYLDTPATGPKIHICWGQHMPPES